MPFVLLLSVLLRSLSTRVQVRLKKKLLETMDTKSGDGPHKKRDKKTTKARSMSPGQRVSSDSSVAARKDSEATTVASVQPANRPSSLVTKNDNQVWDLESALLFLVQTRCKENEYLDKENSSWVSFRVAHAGDASTIANLYRQSPELETQSTDVQNEEEDSSSSSMLELWLAEGLGDEGSPPSVYGLLAHVHTSKKSPTPSESSSTASTNSLGAVSLLTLAWADGERILRVEWMHIDPSLAAEVASTLEQRLWLRLSTLSLMTACQLLAVDEEYTLTDSRGDLEAVKLPPSAE